MGIFNIFKKKKPAPSSAIHRETREDLSRAMTNPSAYCCTTGRTPVFIFRSIDSDYSYRVQEDDFFIGRRYEMAEKLSSYSAVIQAHVRNENGKLYIQNWGTNPIFIDGQEIEGREGGGFTEIKKGDRLNICGVEFTVECTCE